jgi:hypothetical protein
MSDETVSEGQTIRIHNQHFSDINADYLSASTLTRDKHGWTTTRIETFADQSRRWVKERWFWRNPDDFDSFDLAVEYSWKDKNENDIFPEWKTPSVAEQEKAPPKRPLLVR